MKRLQPGFHARSRLMIVVAIIWYHQRRRSRCRLYSDYTVQGPRVRKPFWQPASAARPLPKVYQAGASGVVHGADGAERGCGEKLGHASPTEATCNIIHTGLRMAR